MLRDGVIAGIGRDLDEDADIVIDAHGTTVLPGLIDSHVHPVFGDFTPRQRTTDFLDSALNGGVTTAISAGEVHLPGRPKDIVGLKALAIVAAKAWANFRPGGVKVEGGAPILELGLTEKDFAEMAAAGVKLVGEIGLGSVRTGSDAAPMVRWAKQHGMTVTIHTGGPSIAGSSPINADVVLEARPHVVGHINGGTTSMSMEEIERLVATDMALEIVQCGNVRTALHTLRTARRRRRHRPDDHRQRCSVGHRRHSARRAADAQPADVGRGAAAGGGHRVRHRQHRARVPAEPRAHRRGA